MDQPTYPTPPGGGVTPPDGGMTPPGGGMTPPGGAPKPPQRHRPHAFRTLVTGLVLAAASVALIVGVLSDTHGVATQVGRLGATFHISEASALNAPASTSAIQSRVDPALVNINVANATTGFRGEATGMVLTPTGVVLTNNHVILGATSIKATDIGNGRTYTGSVVGYDKSLDIAIVQLHGASGLRTVPLGNSSSVATGAAVTALGNAGGGGGTPRVATGSVTRLGQSIVASDLAGANAERLTGLIQTSARVLPGDSGGPLVNDAGQVVGMDAAASSANGAPASQNITPQSFAIPINEAVTIAKAIETGPVTTGVHVGPTAFLGVAVIPPSSFAGPFGTQSSGVVVDHALPGYPAQRIGLTQGDVITSVDGHAVTTPTSLTDLLIAHRPGDSVTLTWTGPSGHAHTASVRLASGPPA